MRLLKKTGVVCLLMGLVIIVCSNYVFISSGRLFAKYYLSKDSEILLPGVHLSPSMNPIRVTLYLHYTWTGKDENKNVLYNLKMIDDSNNIIWNEEKKFSEEGASSKGNKIDMEIIAPIKVFSIKNEGMYRINYKREIWGLDIDESEIELERNVNLNKMIIFRNGLVVGVGFIILSLVIFIIAICKLCKSRLIKKQNE